MKLNRTGANTTELELLNGNTVLYSYSTPVAVHIPGQGFYKTTQYYSRTTSKHIGQFRIRHGGTTYHTIEQSALDAMVYANHRALESSEQVA